MVDGARDALISTYKKSEARRSRRNGKKWSRLVYIAVASPLSAGARSARFSHGDAGRAEEKGVSGSPPLVTRRAAYEVGTAPPVAAMGLPTT